MQITNKNIFGALILFILFILSCNPDNLNNYLEHDNEAPDPVSNVKGEGIPGGAIITYDLPGGTKNLDILFVKANYTIGNGKKKEMTASFYSDSIIIKGFGDTSEHEVSLTTVDRSGNESESVILTINPLTPPVITTFESLSYEPDFGGIHVMGTNLSEADLVIDVLTRNSSGEWESIEKEFTSLKEIDFSIRGLLSEETEFAIYITDRWENTSDTIFTQLTPIHEVEFDKNKFQEIPLPGDGGNTWKLNGLWDGITNTHAGLHAPDNNGLPAHWQFSLGVDAKISRFTFWQLFDGREYASNNIKEFELWGSNEPSSDGSFEGWELLGTFEIKKPSGLPLGELTDEDTRVAERGHEFNMPHDVPVVKYVRLNAISTWTAPPNSNAGGIWLTEFSFFGEVE